MSTVEKSGVSQRQAAIIGGIALLIMTISAIFASGFVHGNLIIPGDSEATTNNIIKFQFLFRTGVISWLIILVSDIVVAWAFYIYFKRVNKSLSLLSAWFRLSYTGILAIAISCLIVVLLLIDTNYISIMQGDQQYNNVMLFINAFNEIWNFGLIVFGVHLLLVGFLAIKSKYTPKIIGIILLIASASYFIVHSSYLLFPQYHQIIAVIENILSISAMGEVVFGIWLLIKGGKDLGKSK